MGDEFFHHYDERLLQLSAEIYTISLELTSEAFCGGMLRFFDYRSAFLKKGEFNGGISIIFHHCHRESLRKQHFFTRIDLQH